MLEKSLKEMTVTEKIKKAFDLLDADDAVTLQASRAGHLIEKLESGDVTISIIGQFKRGKSALANSILGMDVLPVGIVPITSAVTAIRYGQPRAEVVYRNGKVEKTQFDELHRFISQLENVDNELDIEEVNIYIPSQFLRGGISFVDTPGVGSFHKQNTEEAYEYMKESDAVIFLLSVDSPINEIEMKFLESTRDFVGKFFFAVNKTDTITPQETEAYIAYCAGILDQVMETKSSSLFPVSAKAGTGVDELKQAIIEDLNRETNNIIESSVIKKMIHIIDGACDQLNFYWKAMNMEYKELDARFEAIAEASEEMHERAEKCTESFALALNDIRRDLSRKVFELFGMEYHYNLEPVIPGITKLERDDFRKAVDDVTRDLSETLDRILLYREENAYTVCHRINAVNRLGRELRRIRTSLAGDLASNAKGNNTNLAYDNKYDKTEPDDGDDPDGGEPKQKHVVSVTESDATLTSATAQPTRETGASVKILTAKFAQKVDEPTETAATDNAGEADTSPAATETAAADNAGETDTSPAAAESTQKTEASADNESDESAPASESRFHEDFRECVFIANTQFRFSKYLSKKLKSIWYDDELQDAIDRVNNSYITYVLMIVGIILVAVFGARGTDSFILFMALIAWIIIDMRFLRPLVYYAFAPKPIRKHIKKVEDLTPQEEEIRRERLNKNERLDKLMKKYRRMDDYDESVSPFDFVFRNNDKK